MPMRRCLVCPRVGNWSGPRCPDHQIPRGGWGSRPDYYDREWTLLSKRYRAEHPTCEMQGCTAPSQHTDHIQPVRAAPHLRLVRSNLRALCLAHHMEVTGRTRYAS